MWRELRRKKQQLSDEECREVLAQGKRGVLAVLGDEQYPYAVPLDYVFDGDSLFFHCAKEGHKLDALRAHDKCSFCVLSDPEEEPGRWWLGWRSVVVFGRATLVSDPGRKLDALRKLGLKYFPETEDVDAEIRRDGPRVEMLELRIEHISGKHVNEK